MFYLGYMKEIILNFKIIFDIQMKNDKFCVDRSHWAYSIAFNLFNKIIINIQNNKHEILIFPENWKKIKASEKEKYKKFSSNETEFFTYHINLYCKEDWMKIQEWNNKNEWKKTFV